MLVEVIKQYARKDDDYIFINAIDKKSQIFNTKNSEKKTSYSGRISGYLFWLTIARMLPSFCSQLQKSIH